MLARNFVMGNDKRHLCLALTLAHFVDTGTVNNPKMLESVVKSVWPYTNQQWITKGLFRENNSSPNTEIKL
jgi:hypothetical protein